MAQRAKARARLLVLLYSHARRCSPACVHARVRVSVHRVYARQNTKWTRVRHGDVYCALVRCFIGVTLRDSFQYSSPSRASFNNAHYDNIPLWLELGGWVGDRAAKRMPHTAVLIFIYVRRRACETRADVKFDNHRSPYLLGDNYLVIKPDVRWLSDAGLWHRNAT